MSAVRRILRIILKFLGFIIGLLVIYLIAGLTLHYIPVNNSVSYNDPGDVTVYLLSNGVHTDMVVPVKNEYMNWNELIKFEHTDTKDTSYKYVGIGWGDRILSTNT